MPDKKQPLKPTSIKIDPALYERVHLYKIKSKKDVQDIISAALTAYLDKRDKRGS